VRPTQGDCLKFMNDSKNAVPDPEHGTWFIGGIEWPEERALMLAEYCLLTGQALTSIATVDGALNLARRIADLEAEIERVKEIAAGRLEELLTELRSIREDCTPWYRRRRG